jgi:hypothetical protein
MRREEYQPRQTPAESAFRKFNVSCVKCGSFRLRLLSQFDEEAGKLVIVLTCPRCREQEIFPIN